MLYDKAHGFRDRRVRHEDLVRRFDGLRDEELCFMVEYQKEPNDIDEAMFHAVNFIQTRGSTRSNGKKDHISKKWARQTTECMVVDIEDDEISETAIEYQVG
ncbi:hypothetical protein DPMN_066419 [Dreissena polymorpha]|uniref:Uncharacterized protein n=1 Tax=Dreissena polymorpha TaxID=45954 RepID=A0A9D4BKH0_DREPO|nr:hypothetical protein DPMN_066419 [Dreissena polymorpha]